MRYYFHLHDDLETFDDEGLELKNAAAAREVAVKIVRELICDDVKAGRVALDHRIDIADQSGAVIDVVKFRDGVRVEG